IPAWLEFMHTWAAEPTRKMAHFAACAAKLAEQRRVKAEAERRGHHRFDCIEGHRADEIDGLGKHQPAERHDHADRKRDTGEPDQDAFAIHQPLLADQASMTIFGAGLAPMAS